MPSDTYCALPHASISIDGPGRPRICCNNKGHYMLVDGPYIRDLTDPVQAMNTDLHREVRLSMSRGERPASCSKCWDMEDSGGKSFRQIWNDVLGTDGNTEMLPDGSMPLDTRVKYIDVTFGNKCNLVCRMCNWANSHLWYHDNIKLGRVEDIDPRLSHQFWFEDESSIELLIGRLSDATHLNFLGGEPLIVPQHMRFLRRCVDIGAAGSMHLSYNTNLTHLPAGLIDLWEMFGHVNVNVSLEAVGQANDYIRQNSDWNAILGNIQLIHGRAGSDGPIRMTIHCTLGVYNALTLGELVSFSRNSPYFSGRLPFINMVYSPEYQDARIMPMRARMLASQRLMGSILGAEDDHFYGICVGAINHMMSPGLDKPTAVPPGWPSDLWLQFWYDADCVDALKNRRMADYLPELSRLRPS